jgi:phenylpropionate dioxygenase-like ring-hydroxylating dioxygenase large terminal subunit
VKPDRVSPPIRYDSLVQDDRIHVSLYTDARIFADEMERIFHRGWVFVGHESEIPRPGDFVTRPIGTQPAIMVRGHDGAIAVLLNRCMHRGTLVCPADRGTTHAASFDKRTRGLARAPRLGSYRGFVFASLAPTGISLEKHLGRAVKLIDRSCDLLPNLAFLL